MKFLILLCGVVSISHDVIIYFWTIQKLYQRSHCIYTTLSDLWGNCEETETPRMIRLKSYSSNTVQIWWHVNLHCVPHNISQFSLLECCRFMYGKVRENVEALLSLFSKYKLFVYGGWAVNTKTARLIYFLFDLWGLELPAINDAPVKQCILFGSFRFDGNLFKLISG